MDQLGFLEKIKVQYNFFKLVKNPNDTRRIISIGQTLTEKSDPQILKTVVDSFFAHPSFKKMWKEKYRVEIPSLQKLANYPKKSFGHEYYLHMTNLNLDPDLFPKVNFSAPETYIISRIYQAHDFWHVLTGFDTSVEQELGLQGFGTAQYQAPLNTLIIAGGLLHLMKNDPLRTTVALEYVVRGYEMGSRCKFLLGEPLLEELHLPLETVRRKYGLRVG